MIKLMIWNVRGIGKKIVRRRINKFMKIHKQLMLVCLEPIVDQARLEEF